MVYDALVYYIFYFALLGFIAIRKQERHCAECEEKALDLVQNLCGHFYCGKY
jgi:hypothetical protein